MPTVVLLKTYKDYGSCWYSVRETTRYTQQQRVILYAIICTQAAGVWQLFQTMCILHCCPHCCKHWSIFCCGTGFFCFSPVAFDVTGFSWHYCSICWIAKFKIYCPHNQQLNLVCTCKLCWDYIYLVSNLHNNLVKEKNSSLVDMWLYIYIYIYMVK